MVQPSVPKPLGSPVHTAMLSRQTSTTQDAVVADLLRYKSAVNVQACLPLGSHPKARCGHGVVKVEGGLLYLGGVDHRGEMTTDTFLCDFANGYKTLPMQLQVWNALVESCPSRWCSGALSWLLFV